MHFLLSADGLTTHQNHFALFQQGDLAYWIGVEDYIFNTGGTGSSDFDYNDLIIELTRVPEPGTMLLGGTGLGLIGIALRRRFFGR